MNGTMGLRVLINVFRCNLIGHLWQVHTTRMHGPCLRPVFTAREHGCPKSRRWTRAVFTAVFFSL